MESRAKRNHMRPALNLMTLLRHNLEDGVAAAAAAGFESVELWVDALERYLKRHSVADLRNLLQEHQVRALSIGDIESVTFCTPQQFAEVRAQCARYAAIAREIGCPNLVVSGSVKPKGIERAALVEEAKSVLGRLLDAVEPEGVGLALAFKGFPWCSIHTLGMAAEVVAHHEKGQARLALDTFDIHNSGAEIEALESLDPERIAMVRLSDCADLPRPLLTDTCRALPGEGITELGAMMNSLARSRFSGAVSLKVLSPRLLNLGAKETAHMVMAAAEPYLAAARSERT